MNRYVCVHGHFYQPPRENPWLDEVEVQEAARPYHDWNERITAECYRPNAWSRVLDRDDYIVEIVNNYSRISFDVGPTLLSWLERRAPDVYLAILGADRESRARYSGHGSALAQAYHHTILPLATRRDKETQIAWGLRDFRRRFGREAEGLWLPEAAADLETLEVLAEAGVRFTILSPYQAGRFRPNPGGEWTAVEPGGIPTGRPYEVALPNGRRLAVFFYNGGLSSDIAFHGLLHDGVALAARLAGAFDPRRDGEPQLSHVATDGETYGHHHRHGDMALAFALRAIGRRADVALTNYGEFLEHYPPQHEVELVVPSAWSCAHGVERWRSDCGCNSGLHPGWNQAWRTPLRRALDHLRDEVRPPTDAALAALFPDPATVRREYVDLLGPRAEGAVAAFLDRHAGHALVPADRTRALRLLEIERQLQQMFTSCGWFFDDISGIETVQVLQFASRAIQLAEETLGGSFETRFLSDLAAARSNVPELGDGAAVYTRLAAPSRIGLRNVCAHYALSSLFEEYPETSRIYSYTVRGRERRSASAGTARLVVGQAEVRSEVTYDVARFTYGALYLAGHNLFGGVRPYQGEEGFRATSTELLDAFERGDLPETIRRVDQHFGEGTYSLHLLFRDEQRRIVELLFESLRDSVETSFRRIYESTAPILQSLAASETPAPPGLRVAAETYLNERIRSALERSPPDVDEVSGRIRELSRANLSVDAASVTYAWSRAAERLLDGYGDGTGDGRALSELGRLVRLAREARLDVDFARVQNRYFDLLHPASAVSNGPHAARTPVRPEDADPLRALGEELRVRGS
jgi:alpha-amylase/alpha-mannosidase (GH57 family)